MCIPLRNFMGAPAPGALMLPTPVAIIMFLQDLENLRSRTFHDVSLCRV